MRAAFVLAILILLIAPARADDTGEARSVIQSQVDAFRRDDAAGAYALAAPAIKNIFPDASLFMDMVRGPYAPVYRHKRFEFGTSETKADGAIVQHVGIVDGDDVAWEAVYTLERQTDGSWKITSCTLKKIGAAV